MMCARHINSSIKRCVFQHFNKRAKEKSIIIIKRHSPMLFFGIASYMKDVERDLKIDGKPQAKKGKYKR